jgi:cation transport ATPase
MREVSAEALRVGDSVLVSPGSLVPVDGTVIGGHSFVASIGHRRIDASRESFRLGRLRRNDQSTGALEIRAEHLGNDTSYGKIIEAVERAEQSRAPVERLADRLASYLVYLALAPAAP